MTSVGQPLETSRQPDVTTSLSILIAILELESPPPSRAAFSTAISKCVTDLTFMRLFAHKGDWNGMCLAKRASSVDAELLDLIFRDDSEKRKKAREAYENFVRLCIEWGESIVVE